MDLQSLCVTIGEIAEIPDAYIAKVSDAVASALRPLTTLVNESLGDVIPHAEAALDAYLPPSKLTAKFPMLTIGEVIVTLGLYAAAMLLCLIISRVVKSKWTLLGTIHNTAMIVVSGYLGFVIIVTAYGCGIRGWNNAVGTDAGAQRLAKAIWLVYVSKVFEFTDTFLMILKRNYRQVSVLHVYHHVSVILIWFFVTRWAPGGEAYFSSSMNCIVHVVMYSYYLVMALCSEGTLRSYLQKRKHLITLIQMTQLALNGLQAVYDLLIVPRGSLRYPYEMLQCLAVYMISLLLLFANFLWTDRARVKRQKVENSTAAAKTTISKPSSSSRGNTKPKRL